MHTRCPHNENALCNFPIYDFGYYSCLLPNYKSRLRVILLVLENLKNVEMPIEQYKVKSFDGLELYCKTWRPDDGTTPKARILYVHGFGEFIDSYDKWFSLFTAAGYEVTSYDQRGHGLTARSKKDFGISDENLIMKDLETMVDYVSKDYEGPLVLYGFSMGGALVLNYMVIGKKRERFDLYLSTSPHIETHPDTYSGLNSIKLGMLPYMVRVWPSYVDKAELKPHQFTNDKSRWPEYKKQPLRHTRSSVRFMYDAVQRGTRLLDPMFISKIVDRPLLISHGLADGICDPDASKKFIDMVPLTDKTLTTYEGLPHGLMECLEVNTQDHWTKLSAWLNSHVAQIHR